MVDLDRFFGNLKAMLAGESLHAISNGVLILLMTNYFLGPDEYGRLSLVLSIVGFIRVGSGLGLSSSTARYITDFRKTDAGQVQHILRFSVLVRLGSTLIAAIALALGSGYLSRFLDQPELQPLLLVGVVYLLAYAMNMYAKSVFQGFNRTDWSAAVMSINSVGRTVFAVGFMALFGLGAAGALAGYVIGAALAAIIGMGYLYSRFYTNFEPAAEMTAGLRRRILEYSVPLAASQGADVVDKQLDTVMVGFFLTPAAVGFYALGKQISEFVITPVSSLGFAIAPTYGEEKADDQLTRAARTYETTFRYSMLLYVPAAVGLFLVSGPTVRYVFGASYSGAIPVVQAFSVYLVLKSLVAISTQSLDYLGRARIRSIWRGTMAGGNVVLNAILIPTIGVVGAAIATVITTGLYALSLLWIVSNEFDLDTHRLLRDAGLIGAISSAVGLSVIATLSYVSGLPSLLGVIALGVLIWAITSIGTGLIDPQQVRSLVA